MKKIIFLSLILLLITPTVTQAALIDDVSGKILLQVEEHGEAWYVNPDDNHRYFMGRPDDAFTLMQHFGLGITNTNLNKIPIGLMALTGRDSDLDGLIDSFEQAIGSSIGELDTDDDGYTDYDEVKNGYSPISRYGDKPNYDIALTNKLKGKILIQVEGAGEAWYVNPSDGKRYFLSRPADAFQVMRELGLGITNFNLNQIAQKEITITYAFPNRYSIELNLSWEKKSDANEELEELLEEKVYNGDPDAGIIGLRNINIEKDVFLSKEDNELGTSSLRISRFEDLGGGQKPFGKEEIGKFILDYESEPLVVDGYEAEKVIRPDVAMPRAELIIFISDTVGYRIQLFQSNKSTKDLRAQFDKIINTIKIHE